MQSYCVCQILRDTVMKVQSFNEEAQAYVHYEEAFLEPSLFAAGEYTSLAVIAIDTSIADNYDVWSLLYLKQTILLVGRNRRLQAENKSVAENLLIATYFEKTNSSQLWEA